MIYTRPGETFTALLTGAPSGLVGTITGGVENVDGTTETAQATTGIVEVESGIYVASRTAPDAGSYVFVWVNGSTRVGEELEVAHAHPATTSYDLSSNMGLVRLKVGDTDTDDPLLTDGEVSALLSGQGMVNDGGTISYNVTAAAADAAGAIAAKFARGYNFSTDGQTFNRSERVNHYRALERRLRNQAGGYSHPVTLAGTATV